MLGRDNAFADLYDPSRKTLSAAGEFARSNLDVAKSYGEWLAPGEVGSAEEVAPGSGALRGLSALERRAAEDHGRGRAPQEIAGTHEAPPTTRPTTTTSRATTTTRPLPTSPINGLPVEDVDLLERRLMAVKIDNQSESLALSGGQ